jgi:hypothetical protein
MSEKKHTPGPWFDWKEKRWLHEPKKLLASYEDACLIAAAPDLLEACKEALNDIEYVTSSHPEITGTWQRSKALHALRAEIAKACP